jgi:hypothetical protein
MRWVRGSGLCLLAACALAAATAAGASAEAPEFGRCLKQAGGKFKGSNCTTEAPGGQYEWFSGVVKNKFTVDGKEGTLFTLESVTGAKITCRTEASTGEFTGPKTMSLTLTFAGCETSGGQCHSKGQPEGTVVTSPLVGELGTVKSEQPPTKSKLGLQLRPATGELFVEFTCAGTLRIEGRGSLIVAWPANKMASVYTIKLTAKKGKQTPEKFEGGPVSRLELNAGTGFEQVGLTGVLIFALEEKVEASSVN